MGNGRNVKSSRGTPNASTTPNWQNLNSSQGALFKDCVQTDGIK